MKVKGKRDISIFAKLSESLCGVVMIEMSHSSENACFNSQRRLEFKIQFVYSEKEFVTFLRKQNMSVGVKI